MAYVQEKCPTCGGPLPAASVDWLVCKFCGAELKPAPGAQYHIPPKLEEPPYEPHVPRADVVGTRYVLLGKLARGATADLLLGRKDARLTETVVIKVAHAPAQNDRVAREWKSIKELHEDKRESAEHFARLLPQPVLHGAFAGSDRLASVFRWRTGFQYTLEDARKEYPEGVDPRAAVWMWKRTLDMLGWLHEGGWVHGAIDPSHLVFHPRDHGVIFTGWSSASRGGAAADDVAASARAIAFVLGGSREDVPPTVPAPLAALVRKEASSPSASAWAVKTELDRAAQAAFGAPRYHRFTMDGWG